MPGNNPKQIAVDQLRGFDGLRRSELNDSGIIQARCADTGWRNEELFADILRQRGGWSPIDSARLTAWNVEGAGGLFPGSDLGQNNPEKIVTLNQLLT